MENKLIDQMERYTMIRHDDELNEDKKEAIREKILEGDHPYPSL
jgi:hypothetical protein